MVSSFVSHHFADVLRFSQLFFVSGCHFAVAVVFCGVVATHIGCWVSHWLFHITLLWLSGYFVVNVHVCGCFVLKLKVFAVVLWVCSSFLTVTLTVGLVLVSVMHTVYVCLQPAAPKWFVLILFSHEDVKTGRIKSINSVLLKHAGLLCIEGLMWYYFERHLRGPVIGCLCW